MKTTNATLFILLLGVALFIACSDDTEPLVVQEIESMLLQAEVTSDFINPHVGQSFNICGNSTDCNLVNTAPSIKLSGRISEVDDSGEFSVSDGVLYLCVQSTGCNLIGYYTGNGLEDDFGVRLSALVYVDHGVGEFKADGGQLQLTMIGERLANNDNEMKFNIEVNGHLSNYIYNLKQ